MSVRTTWLLLIVACLSIWSLAILGLWSLL